MSCVSVICVGRGGANDRPIGQEVRQSFREFLPGLSIASQYSYPAKSIPQSYSRKFKKLDNKFAADVLGDGNDGTVGPFEAAQKRFYCGQVIPLCAGWFG